MNRVLVSWFLKKIATDLFSEGWIVQIKYDDDDDDDDDEPENRKATNSLEK